jgi:hypothetical protein
VRECHLAQRPRLLADDVLATGAHACGVCARVALAVALSSGAAACATSTKASPYNRDCGTAGGGFVTTNDRWKSSGPWHVEMSAATARSIARRVGPNEFQPSGSHPRAKDVPCVVASSVAYAGADSWSIREATDGWVSVAWASYASGPRSDASAAGRHAAGRAGSTRRVITRRIAMPARSPSSSSFDRFRRRRRSVDSLARVFANVPRVCRPRPNLRTWDHPRRVEDACTRPGAGAALGAGGKWVRPGGAGVHHDRRSRSAGD